MSETAETLEAPGRFELPNEGFADDADAATGGQNPATAGASDADGGRGWPGDPGAGRERSGPRDDGWRRRAALARWGTLADRFWRRVARSPGDGCWEWQGARDADGYGRLEALGKVHALAHRVAWEVVNGAIPDGLMVCHRCDNPRCVRAEPGRRGHLFLGTPRENTQDSLRKGRHGSLKQAGKKRGPYRKQAA